MRIPATPKPLSGSVQASDAPIYEIGSPVWNHREIAEELKGFLPFYESRPIRQNDGGMKSSGLFTLWHIVRKFNPKLVFESGVWKGQSTWLLENALPKALIVAIDPAAEGILYRTKRAEYMTQDFLASDWRSLGEYFPDTLAFFDDHQDVFPRLKACRELGIKTVILDDNYPEYSGNRHVSMAALLNQKNAGGTHRYPAERAFLLENTASYHMFPPIFDYLESVTMEQSRITVPSVFGAFDPVRHAGLETYWQDASSYRWTTLVRFK
jgi:hypothetical protein